jgi:hypothetical protein
MAKLEQVKIGALVSWREFEERDDPRSFGVIVGLNEHIADPRSEAHVLWHEGFMGWLYMDDEAVEVVQSPSSL